MQGTLQGKPFFNAEFVLDAENTEQTFSQASGKQFSQAAAAQTQFVNIPFQGCDQAKGETVKGKCEPHNRKYLNFFEKQLENGHSVNTIH